MKIAMLGSTGFTGRVLLEKALDAGHEVRTLVRSPDKLGSFRERVKVVEGTIFQPRALEATVAGTEAVLSTVGPPQKNPGDPAPYEEAMKHLVAAMEKHGVRRLVHIGGSVHPGGENESWPIGRRLLRLVLNTIWKSGLAAKHLEWEVLKASAIDWTLVRPPRIVKGESIGRLEADERQIASLQVNVGDLADFMLDQLTSTEWVRKAPLVATGK